MTLPKTVTDQSHPFRAGNTILVGEAAAEQGRGLEHVEVVGRDADSGHFVRGLSAGDGIVAAREGRQFRQFRRARSQFPELLHRK